MEQHSFGYWLKLKRKALDLTREQLAERVGYSAATIRKIEDEERRPSAQVVERLAEIFHIPPDERTAFLRFARGDWKAGPSDGIESSPWRARARSTRTNLPATMTSLVGREKESVDVRDYLLEPEIRLVTLTGPPGIGKTRLSIEAARAAVPAFPDGVFFVPLAPLDDPALIAPAVAQALGYIGAQSTSITEQLIEGMGNKYLLLVLDNCEHLIEDSASLALELLSACPHLKILATSRESLRIPGEWLFPVPTLEFPDASSPADLKSASNFPALTLFAERARAVKPDFVLDAENIRTVSTICAHLDGLPLVIELIAARMRLMSPESLLTRLNKQFILTADGMRARSARQKTLNNAIDWSYKLLSEEEQNLFARLSVFWGGFTLEAAEAMFSRTGEEKSVPVLIALLLDKSILQHSADEHGKSRYIMLVTIQEFARDRLRQMGEETEFRNRHLMYFLGLAEEGDRELRGHNQLEWLQHLGAEVDNLRAALDWAIETLQTKTALQMARKLHWFWFVRGDHTEGRRWLERVLAMPDMHRYPDGQAEALTQLAHHSFLLGHRFGLQNEDHRLVTHLAEQALMIARTNGDKHNAARALAMFGLDKIEEGNFEAAGSALEESQALYQEVNDEWGYAHALMCLGYWFISQDNPATAISLNDQALAVFRKLGDRYFMCVTLRGIVIGQVKQNNLANTGAVLQEALMAAYELKSKYEIAATLSWWGEMEKHLGNPARAVCLYWAAKNLFDTIGAWTRREEAEFDKDIATCRDVLSETAYTTAMEEGRAMTMEKAIAYALEDQGG